MSETTFVKLVKYPFPRSVPCLKYIGREDKGEGTVGLSQFEEEEGGNVLSSRVRVVGYWSL